MAFNDLYSFDLAKGLKSLELYTKEIQRESPKKPESKNLQPKV